MFKAFNEINGYGVSLPVSAEKGLKLWGCPSTIEDISQVFLKHVSGEIDAIPWSEADDLNAETSIISEHLRKLNEKGWWTLASQPAVNGKRSDDKLVGWGPKGGFGG